MLRHARGSGASADGTTAIEGLPDREFWTAAGIQTGIGQVDAPA